MTTLEDDPQTKIFVGMVIEGFCNGYFDGDYFSKKTIEAYGDDWVVVRREDGQPFFSSFGSAEYRDSLINDWMMENE